MIEVKSPQLDPQLIIDESKETLELGGNVKIEDDDDPQYMVKLEELMKDEPSDLATASKSEALDFSMDAGSDLKLESKSIVAQKRRRVLLDAIEIRTPQWLLRTNRVKQETQADREKEFLNPKFKIKRPTEAVQEGLGSVFRRVDALSIKPFLLPARLERDLLEFTVSREFTSSLYGGNPQQTLPTLSKDNCARHPYRDFMYLNLIYNPYAPQRPGHPGLFYRCRDTELPKELRLFIRIQHGVWLYLGQYELIPAEPLTKEEWAAKSFQTKGKWCKDISEKQWGKRMRARIALRHSLGREPTPQEIEASKGLGVSVHDVRRALDSGVEAIQVFVMKCVGYDEAFQREMKDKRSIRTPSPNLEKVNSPKKGANQVSRGRPMRGEGHGTKKMSKR